MEDKKKYFINRIIQSGIYYFQLSDDGKTRPYLIISKDDGYGANVLAFQITEQFTSSRVNLPIVINNMISFIRISGTKEVSKIKIIDSSFDGLLRPDIFSIAIRMYTRRFANVNEDELNIDLNNYLNELDSLQVPLYKNRSLDFKKEDYLNNTIGEISTAKVSFNYKETKKENYSTIKSDEVIKKEVMSEWSENRLIKFQNDMRIKSNDELQKIFGCDLLTVDYIKRNIRYLLKSEHRRHSSNGYYRNQERKKINARNTKI